MNQSNGSSVQTEIFPPENIRSYTKYTKRHTDIMLGCFVVGENQAFIIETNKIKTISQLRDTIKAYKENVFKTFDANQITLWKVDIPVMKKQEINTDTNIAQKFGAVELKEDFDTIEEHFGTNPTTKNIHVIVYPPPPATTGKRRWDFDEDNEDRDRKKVETILNCAQKIMKSIMKLPENPEAYSNPKEFLTLPFPFIGDRKPIERFIINDDKFIYMGRRAFVNVLNTIKELKRGSYMDCFIYGTIGYGKSYLLATIACFLLRTKQRVVYLPDCRELAKDPESYIKLALILAYTDNIEKINEISACKTIDDIVAFCKLSEPLYFIVDQMNALDYSNNTGIDKVDKSAIIKALNKMTSVHCYIKSSSANNESALHLVQKQTNDKRIELYGGFDEDEMSQWWIQNRENLPSMDDEQRKKIEYTTGRNPLFLSFLPVSEKNFDDAWKRLIQILMEKIQVQMTSFSDLIKRERCQSWDTHIELMSSCLTNGYAPSGYGINDYDHRFFYIDKDRRCHYTSGFVRDCMADYLFEKGKLEVFTTSSWLQCIKKFRDNPSVKGFMVEKACLASIWKNGFMVDAINFKSDSYKFFTGIGEINPSTNEGLCTFYIPRLWNQKSIDGLLTLYKKNTLYIAPIQITLDKNTHSDSEGSFFSGIWPELKLKISNNLKVEVIFIWITRENDVDSIVEANEKTLRGRTIEINPEYTTIVMSFKNINNDLEDILSYL